MKTWNIEALTGYKPKTTFYEDFSIADQFGEEAIVDTFTRVFEEWKHDVEYLTELVMVLNWKTWEHFDEKQDYAYLYQQLWEKADGWAVNNLKSDNLEYFYRTTD